MAKKPKLAIPYHAQNKSLDLTCPHCKGMLFNIENTALWALYKCNCGKWTQYARWGTKTSKKPDWEYIPKE